MPQLHRQIFNMFLQQTVAMIFVNNILIPVLQSQNYQVTIMVIIIHTDDDEDMNDEYIELENGESLSVPSDWEED